MSAVRVRKSPEVRRQEILDALISVGTARGLDGITVRDVAHEANVTPGLIHHYFPSMDELLATAFGDWADRVLQRARLASEGTSPRMGLALLVADITPDQRLWNNALNTASRFELLRNTARDLSVGFRDHVESLIRAGNEEGTFTCTDPRATAWRMILMIDGLVPMVHVLKLIDPLDIPGLIGPVIENELGLGAGSFTELVFAIMRDPDTT